MTEQKISVAEQRKTAAEKILRSWGIPSHESSGASEDMRKAGLFRTGGAPGQKRKPDKA